MNQTTTITTPVSDLAISTIARPKTTTSRTSGQPKRIRIQAKNWILTFPQCDVSKDIALQRLTSSELRLKAAIICQEKHADGDSHLHIGIFLEEKLRISDPAFFDFVCEKHGNYQSMKSISGTIAYLHKEDPAPLIYGDMSSIIKGPSQSKSEKVATMINSGFSIDAVAQEMPGFFLLNKRKIEEYNCYYLERLARQSKKQVKLPIQYTGADTDTQTVVDWLNANLLVQRPFKSPQLFISGPPNSLKTSLCMRLGMYLRVYEMPILEDFYDFYQDDNFDLVVLDEFKGQKTMQFLNLWLQGSTMNVRKKGTQAIKRKNLPMIICSNYRLHECYKDTVKLQTLRARLVEIDLLNPIDLDNIQFE